MTSTSTADRPGWRGVFPYLPTPLHGGDRVDADRMGWLARRVADAGVHGVTPLGSTGEGPLLSQPVRETAIEAVVRAVAGRVPVVPGICGFATSDLVSQAVRARDLGADGLLLMLQSYFPLGRDEIVGAARAVVDAVDVPVVFYHHPELCGVRLDLDTVVALHLDGGIGYVKDASGDVGNIRRWRESTGAELEVFAATAVSPAEALAAGACGLMSGPSSMFPAECVALFDSAEAGDERQVRALEAALASTLALFRALGPGRAVKALFAADGIDLGGPVPPGLPLTSAEVRAAAGCIDDVRSGQGR